MIPSTHSRSFLPLLACGLLVCGGLLARADDGDEAFAIKVRTTVDRPLTLFGKSPPVVHSKLYAIAGVVSAYRAENDLSNPIMMPVDEDALRTQLKTVLSARGFREAAWGRAPDVVLSVLYGRGHIRNPYADKFIEMSPGGLSTSRVYAASSEQVLREKEPGYDEKLKEGDVEKLFIIINAWKYSGFTPTEKPKLLWRTTVFVDDPDRNLNVIAGQMLAAAGAYFDRKIDKEEIALLSNELPASETTKVGSIQSTSSKGGSR